jgi:1,5-anhydro-D-fructose reductase (1,5-anhydro-D-mannitol-forming)
VSRAADLDPATIARLAAEHLGIVFSTEPTDVIGADGVDAVYIATPPGTHAALVVPALQAGQAVFCEKPLSVSTHDAEAMLSAAEASGRTAARCSRISRT